MRLANEATALASSSVQTRQPRQSRSGSCTRLARSHRNSVVRLMPAFSATSLVEYRSFTIKSCREWCHAANSVSRWPQLCPSIFRASRKRWGRLAQETEQLPANGILVPSLAFPNNEGHPSQVGECPKMDGVTGDVAGNFLCPVASVCFRLFVPGSAAVSMPEAPMDKNNLATRRENNVWRARQVSTMKAEAVSKSVG